MIDAMWRGGRPMYETNNKITPPSVSDEWQGFGHEMKHFCMDRHSKTVNMVYMDLSADEVKLKNLWRQKWHKKFNTSGYIENTGAAWPGWMENLPE
jgi:hypothetical protein